MKFNIVIICSLLASPAFASLEGYKCVNDRGEKAELILHPDPVMGGWAIFMGLHFVGAGVDEQTSYYVGTVNKDLDPSVNMYAINLELRISANRRNDGSRGLEFFNKATRSSIPPIPYECEADSIY